MHLEAFTSASLGDTNMINQVLLCAGAVLPLIWGVVHLFPTKNVVAGFGDILAPLR